jgi:chromosomal replication initiation ATPase DnaA
MNEQQIFNLNSEEHFFEDDFCISQSNQDVYDYLFKWPSWESNILNIHGPSKSGKTFLLTIFAQKHSFIKISSKGLSSEKIDFLLSQKSLIVEDIDQSTSEEILFLIFNDFKANNKFLVFSSTQDSSNIKFELKDLASRFKSVFNLEISNPSDNLLYSILLKQLSSRQIVIKKELLTHIINRIERTYNAVNKFVVNIDKESLVNKKKIDLKLINQVLTSQ